MIAAAPAVVALAAPEPVLLTWRLEASCGGVPLRAAEPVEPLSELRYARPSDAPEPPMRVRFRIDATGRALSIAAEGDSWRLTTGDLGPALAATRFAPGADRTGCVAQFTPMRKRLADADPAVAIGNTVFPTGGSRPPRALLERFRPAGSTCTDPGPAVLIRAFPDFKTVPQAPGTVSWSMVGFDIDAAGRPVRVHRVAGSGNAVLDVRSIAAVHRSRFERGARRGCLYPYYRRGDPLPAPEITVAKDYRPTGSTCPAGEHAWTRPPSYSYPANYRRRGIEGWAVVQYDVAPWGEIGNLRVLAAEPAASFGESATAVLRGATRPPSGGLVGCVDRVRFVMRTPAHPGPDQVPADPVTGE